MFSSLKKITGILMLLISVNSSAQQIMSDYNLLDNIVNIAVEPVDNQTIGYLNDYNQDTFFEVPNFNTNVKLIFQFESPVIVKGYNIVSADDELCDPKNFKLEGSDDGNAWIRFGTTVYGQTFPGRFQTATILLNTNTKAYKYIRLTVLTLNGGTTLKIADFQLLGYPESFKDDLSQNTSTLATSQYNGSGSYSFSNVRDNDVNKLFKQTGTSECWLQYELNTQTKISAYALQSTSSNIESDPCSWELTASTDGENWDVLDTRLNKNSFDVLNNLQLYNIGSEKKTFNWAALADSAQSNMLKMFWKSYGNGMYLTHSYHPNPDSINTGFNYWWMAHAIDVFVDAYARTGDDAYKTQMNSVYNAMKYSGGGSLHNGFFDDMEWMGLACLRANEVYYTNPKWKEAAIQLWDWIKMGWNENQGGGIQWVDTQPNSKNACSNAPAIILAARLYQLTNDETYLDWAVKIFNWMNNNLIFSENGLVKDAYNNNQLSWTLTYNQGTWIGACLELYKITNDTKYYDIAMKTADYVVNDYTKFSPNGILYNNEGGGDGGLFKGIFMRYLSQWILSGKLDDIHRISFINYFIQNGRSLAESATLRPLFRFGNTWLQRPEQIQTTDKKSNGYDASIHLSGVMMFELLDELRRSEFISDDNLQPEISQYQNKAYKYVRLNIKSTVDQDNIELTRWQLWSKNQNTATNLITNILLPKVIIYNRNVIIESSSAFTYQIFNINGYLLKAGMVNNSTSSESLNVSGIYLIQFQSGKTVYTQKVLIP